MNPWDDQKNKSGLLEVLKYQSSADELEPDSDPDRNSTHSTQDQERLYYTTRENFILPVNKRTLQMKKEKEKAEQLLLQQRERQKQEQMQREKKDQELREREAREKSRIEAREKLREFRRREEAEELGKMNGEFGTLYQSFLKGDGLKEVFLSGRDFRPVQFRLLFRALEFNKVIKTLSINRFGIFFFIEFF